MDIIKENRIQLVSSLQHWSVVGSSGDIYVVKLFKGGVRNQTCTCAASAICSHILAAMYSIDYEMLSKKKGNITATQRKGRTQQRYRHCGKKPPSKLEKNSSRTKAKVLKKKKEKNKAMTEMFNCTPESPDASDFNDNLSDVSLQYKISEAVNVLQEHPKMSPDSQKRFSDGFSPWPTSARGSQGKWSPSACSPSRSWAQLQLLEPDGSLSNACSQQSSNFLRSFSEFGSPQTHESPKSPSSPASSKSSGAEKKDRKQLALRLARCPHVCKEAILTSNLK